MAKLMRAIGLMSGTSMDGIDVALIETDGADRANRGPSATYPYAEAFRQRLRAASGAAAGLARRHERPGSLAAVEAELTQLHAEAAERFFAAAGLAAAQIDVVGFHGHTVLHAPQRGLTVQLGDGAGLARRLSIDVVYDLRAADVAAGGQGAPLAPAYHGALMARQSKPVVIVNIGGVANVTWIGSSGELLAFDTGPGNALIDDWMRRRQGLARDDNGQLAATGRAHAEVVTGYLRHAYFGEPPPKSLDRDAFGLDPVAGLGDADGAATLTAFTVESIARAREHFPEQPRLWVVSGGGRRNKTLMAMLAGKVEAAVAPAEAAGVDGDAMEAEAWAYLAVRCLKGLPISFPGTTGAPAPLSGGVVARRAPSPQSSPSA
jgi:anhydro-N-acetylmuramic acid kinase